MIDLRINSGSESFRLVDTVERLQSISRLSDDNWLDLMQLTWEDYYAFRSEQIPIPHDNLERVANFFGLGMKEVLLGRIDFQSITNEFAPTDLTIPDKYLFEAHGRMRSTITSIEFLEKKFGWRLKRDVLKRFDIADPSRMDAFAPISIQLITDMCDYLHKRQFTPKDFFNMGAHSFEGNRQSIVGKLYSEMPSYRDAFAAFATVLMPMFEKNCVYTFEMKDDVTGIVHSRSNRDIASAMGVKYLGSSHVCHVKAGIWASIASYFSMTLPRVTHPECEHRGDHACKYVFDFSQSRVLTDTPQTGSN